MNRKKETIQIRIETKHENNVDASFDNSEVACSQLHFIPEHNHRK